MQRKPLPSTPAPRRMLSKLSFAIGVILLLAGFLLALLPKALHKEGLRWEFLAEVGIFLAAAVTIHFVYELFIKREERQIFTAELEAVLSQQLSAFTSLLTRIDEQTKTTPAEVLAIQRSLESIEARLKSVTQARVLSGNDEFYRTLRLLLTPKSELCATTFSDFVKTQELPGAEVQIFFKTLDDYLCSSSEFRLWRVAYVPNLKKLEWLKQTIQTTECSLGYHLAVVSTDLSWIPLMNMSIVDGRHLILFGKHEIADEPNFIYVDSPAIAAAARQLFDQWWRVSVKLKEGSIIHHQRLAKIEDDLKKRDARSPKNRKKLPAGS